MDALKNVVCIPKIQLQPLQKIPVILIDDADRTAPARRRDPRPRRYSLDDVDDEVRNGDISDVSSTC